MASDFLIRDLATIRRLLDDLTRLEVRHDPFRHHRIFSPEERASIALAEARSAAATAIAGYAACDDGGRLAGLALLSPLPWDSAFFSAGITRLRVWRCPGQENATAGLSGALSCLAAEAGVRHVCCEVDSDDYPLLNELAAAGFRLMDLKRTFVARQGLRFSPLRGGGVRVRDFETADRPAVMALYAAQRFVSRYTRDHFFDSGKAQAAYGIWAGNLMDRPAAERVFMVAERTGQVVAAGGVCELDFRSAGIDKRILGGGVFAADASGRGAYMPVLRSLIESGWERGYPLLETKVSINNLAACRVLEKMGASSVTAHYVLHFSPEAPAGEAMP